MSAPTFVAKRSADAAAGAGAPGALRVSSLSRRAAAVLLDSCVLLVLWIPGLVLIWLAAGADADYWNGLLQPSTDDPTTEEVLVLGAQSLVSLVAWTLYAGLITSRPGAWNGQTLGKRAAGLRIVTAAGQPLSRRTAWRRVGLASIVFGVPTVVGPLFDVARGQGWTGTEVGLAVGMGLAAVAVLITLRGGLRQTAFDVAVGTLVVEAPAAGAATVRAEPAAADETPVTTFEQTPTVADPAPVIVPRRRTARTWLGVTVTALLCLAFIPLSQVDLPEDRTDEILALPETKEALARLRQLEPLVVACLASRTADACDEPAELKAPDAVEFTEDFDLDRDPVGAQAGKIGLAADGDGTIVIYAFTSVDRIWTSFVEGDDIDRVCFKSTSDAQCDAVYW